MVTLPFSYGSVSSYNLLNSDRNIIIYIFFGMHGNPRLLFHTSTQTYTVFSNMGNISPHTHTAPSAPTHTNTHVPSPPSHTPATTIHTNTTHTLTHTIRPQLNMEYEKHKLFAVLQCIIYSINLIWT